MSQIDQTPAPAKLPVRGDEFDAVRRLLYKETGIVLNDGKLDMVRARLAKRIRHHGLNSMGEYVRLLESQGASGAERQEFVNCLTTNKTDFFREPHHFDYLRETLIPQLRANGKKKVRIWSAGCSTGEEPYTLAMTFREECPAAQGWDVKILASDIDTAVLASAEMGIYADDRLGGISEELLRKYFLRGTGANAKKAAVRPDLRNAIEFRQVNFMEQNWPVPGKYDAIFCRNVMIYFDRETQRRLLTRFTSLLEPGGVIFLGHSESLYWMADSFKAVGNTIYLPRNAGEPPEASPKVKVASVAKPTKAAPPEPAEQEHSIILGDVKATRGPSVIKTLLGSCVSACIYDPETGVGGMNHFSLPGVSDDGMCARYGAYAMELLVTEIMKKGGNRHRLRAKVFGGAKVLNIDSEHLNVGAKNAAFVIKFLADEGIPLESQCLGGTRGLIVRFRPHTGKVQVKPLAGRELEPVVEREASFGRELLQRVATPPDDSITLF